MRSGRSQQPSSPGTPSLFSPVKRLKPGSSLRKGTIKPLLGCGWFFRPLVDMAYWAAVWVFITGDRRFPTFHSGRILSEPPSLRSMPGSQYKVLQRCCCLFHLSQLVQAHSETLQMPQHLLLLVKAPLLALLACYRVWLYFLPVIPGLKDQILKVLTWFGLLYS